MKTKSIQSSRSRIGAPLLAAPLLALLLAGCNRAEEAPTAPPASPASTAPGSSTPAAGGSATPDAPASSGAPASSSTPSSSSATPGTPEGAAATLPASGTTAPAPGNTAVDAKETRPLGEITKQEENKGMPEAMQGNNHSSPAADQPPAKP